MNITKLFGGTIVALTLSAPVYADTILYDPTGNGGTTGGSVDVDAMDVLPGNGLAIDAVPLLVDNQFQFYYQAEVVKITSATGTNIDVPVGADGPYEITTTANFTESVNSAIDLNGSGIPNLIVFDTIFTANGFALYYDPLSGGTINADEISGNSGLGYDDGILILAGDILAGTATSTYTISPDNETATTELDQFGTDGLGGVETLVGNGNAVVDVAVTFQNSDYFPSIFDIISVTFDGTLADPFDSINPSLLVAGFTPDYGPNDINGLLGGTAPEDFHFEVDGNLSFGAERQVPEPSTLALMGLALAAVGGLRRRRQTA